jgi:hypothetical protein
VFSRHPDIGYVLYADDIQLYVSCHVKDVAIATKKLEDCIHDIRVWLMAHRLILNINKTDFIIFHSSRSSFDSSECSLVVDDIVISSKAKVRDLGILFDSHLQMEDHVTNVCKTATFYLRLICRSRQYLTRQTTAILVNSLVLSRFEYCPSLLYGISGRLHKKIDRVLRYGMRVIEGLKKKIDVSPYLKKHGWLSSEQRSRLRIALLVNKIYHLNLPVQLADILSLLNAASTGHNLRSTACGLFNITRTRTKMGDRTFASAATKIWNELPLDIRESVRQSVFKDKVVKHYLL